MRAKSWIRAVTVCVSSLVGCGEDGEGKPGPEQAGLTIANLTAEQAQALCQELHEYALRSWNGPCTEEGIEREAEGLSTCEAARQACIAQTTSDCTLDKVRGSGVPGCDAVLVEDLRTCIQSVAESNEATYGVGVTCETGVQQNAPGSPSPACQRIATACGSVLDTASDRPSAGDGDGDGDSVDGGNDDGLVESMPFVRDHGDGLSEVVLQGSIPWDVVADRSGGVWVSWVSGLLHISAELEIQELRPGLGKCLALDAAGNVWQSDTQWIWRTTPAGEATKFTSPTANGSNYGISITADGNVWFTEQKANKIGRLDPAGVFTEFSSPTPEPVSMAIGPDGLPWFTSKSGTTHAITSSGEITERKGGTYGTACHAIVAGADGSMWFTQAGYDSFARLDAQGELSFFRSPHTTYNLALGPDGKIYFNDQGVHGAIGRIDDQGNVEELLQTNLKPQGLAVSTDGAVWYTSGSAVWRLEL